MRRAAMFAALIGAIATSAAAHVAPSLDTNNRYLKFTPLADRLRLAYTVYFGEVPGAALRQQLDEDRDGEVSDEEAQRHGQLLGDTIARNLELVVDGVAVTVSWSEIHPGLGTPRVAAGSFSMDLVAWVCTPGPGDRHTVLFRDNLELASPGETELLVEPSTGVRVDVARIGNIDVATTGATWEGALGPISDDGLTLTFVAGARAQRLRDGRCAVGRSRSPSRAPVAALLVAAALAGAAGLYWQRQRKMKG